MLDKYDFNDKLSAIKFCGDSNSTGMRMAKFRVYLGACSEYDVSTITNVIDEAVNLVQPIKPVKGRIVIKPNLVMAHPKIAIDSYTHKEAVEGMLGFLRQYDQIEKIDIVEKSGLGVTTAAMFRYSGYRDFRRKYGIGLVAMEESRKKRVALKYGKIHTSITIAREIAERDFLIFMPKLKTNVLSHAYSGALKLNIGTIDGKERLFHHNRDLHIKIVDILEAANPDLIVTDGIRMAFGGNQMTQIDIPMGVIAVSTNAVAHDMVCASMIGLDPHKIEHIREAINRGYGPRSMDDIEILGDFPVEKAQGICKNLDFGFYPVQEFKSPMKIYSGTPYCTGGCHGIFLDWLHMNQDRKPGLNEKLPNIPVLIGNVDEQINAKKIVMVGDCAMASSHIKAKRIIRIKGCPPSHKRIILTMLAYLAVINPLVRPSLIYDGFVLYPLKKLKGWLVNRFTV